MTTDVNLYLPKPAWFHPNGMDMKAEEVPANQRELMHTSGAHHVKAFKHRFGDIYEMSTFAFRNGGDFRAELRFPMNGGMFATAYDLDRDISVTDDAYAERFQADFGIPGVYLRRGNYLILGGVGHGLETDPFPCTYLHDYIRKDADRVRRYVISPM